MPLLHKRNTSLPSVSKCASGSRLSKCAADFGLGALGSHNNKSLLIRLYIVSYKCLEMSCIDTVGTSMSMRILDDAIEFLMKSFSSDLTPGTRMTFGSSETCKTSYKLKRFNPHEHNKAQGVNLHPPCH